MRCVPARSYDSDQLVSCWTVSEYQKQRQLEHTWKTMPEEMIGVIPSSIRVPRLLASIIRSQYRGSEVSDETMP